jgi:hypothetical protein
MACRAPPYAELLHTLPPRELMRRVAQYDLHPVRSIPADARPDWPDEVNELAGRCAEREPRDRPSFDEIVVELTSLMPRFSVASTRQSAQKDQDEASAAASDSTTPPPAATQRKKTRHGSVPDLPIGQRSPDAPVRGRNVLRLPSQSNFDDVFASNSASGAATRDRTKTF